MRGWCGRRLWPPDRLPGSSRAGPRRVGADLTGGAIGRQLTGILVRTNDAALRDALVAGLDAAIADGTYGRLLKKWNLGVNGIEKATVNAGQ